MTPRDLDLAQRIYARADDLVTHVGAAHDGQADTAAKITSLSDAVDQIDVITLASHALRGLLQLSAHDLHDGT